MITNFIIFIFIICIMLYIIFPENETKCEIGGCSSQICAKTGKIGIDTCEWKPEYACYKNAVCDINKDDICQWIPDKTLSECLNRLKN